MTEPPLISFTGIERHYGEGGGLVRALAGVDLTISRGEFIAIMGPSGSGKSTAMNIIGCLDRSTAGSLPFQRRRCHRTDPRSARAAPAQLPRLRVPGLQSSRPHHGDRERRAAPHLPRHGDGANGANVPCRPCIAWAWQAASTIRLPNCPAASSSAWQSPAPSSPIRWCCWPTSRPAIWIPHAAARSCSFLPTLNADQGITVVMVTHEADMAAYAQRTIRFVDGRIDSDDAARGRLMLWEAVKLAFQSIRRNAMRSVLTLLGIVIGVAAVIAMVTIGSGHLAEGAGQSCQAGQQHADRCGRAKAPSAPAAPPRRGPSTNAPCRHCDRTSPGSARLPQPPRRARRSCSVRSTMTRPSPARIRTTSPHRTGVSARAAPSPMARSVRGLRSASSARPSSRSFSARWSPWATACGSEASPAR